jgi:hypothetical protein
MSVNKETFEQRRDFKETFEQRRDFNEDLQASGAPLANSASYPQFLV